MAAPHTVPHKVYDPEKHCPIAIETLAEGLGKASIAARCGVAEKTLYAWIKKYEEFDEAVQIGMAKGADYYQVKLRDAGTIAVEGNYNALRFCAQTIHREAFKDPTKFADTEVNLNTTSINIDFGDANG